jgi:hypothetical protein
MSVASDGVAYHVLLGILISIVISALTYVTERQQYSHNAHGILFSMVSDQISVILVSLLWLFELHLRD